MGRKKLGRTKQFNARLEPETYEAIKEQKPTANDFVHRAIDEKIRRDTVVFKGTMSEVQKQIAMLKRKYGSDTPMSEVIKRMAEND